MIPLSSIADRVRTESTVATLREPAFVLLSRIQDLNPSDQVRALFLTACVVADTIGLNPHEEIERAARIMRPAEGPHTVHIQAIRAYAEGELRHIS